MGVVQGSEGRCTQQVAELTLIFVAVGKYGFAPESKRLAAVRNGVAERVDKTWRNLPDVRGEVAEKVFVYPSALPRRGKPSVWAAVEVDAGGGSLTF